MEVEDEELVLVDVEVELVEVDVDDVEDTVPTVVVEDVVERDVEVEVDVLVAEQPELTQIQFEQLPELGPLLVPCSQMPVLWHQPQLACAVQLAQVK